MNHFKNGYDEVPPALTPASRVGTFQRRIPPTAYVRQTVSSIPAPVSSRMYAETPVYEEYYDPSEEYSNHSDKMYQQQETSQPIPVRYPSVSRTQQQNIPDTFMANPVEEIDVNCPDECIPSSPVCFKDFVPGAWEHIVKERSLTSGKAIAKIKTELDASDVKLVNELGQLSVDDLLDYMKNLQNNAFMLGEEEGKEFQRAKFIGMFNGKTKS